MHHCLKTFPELYKDIEDGTRRFEVRHTRENFKEGDVIFFQEYEPKTGEYTGNETAQIIDKIYPELPGLCKGYCVLSLRDRLEE